MPIMLASIPLGYAFTKAFDNVFGTFYQLKLFIVGYAFGFAVLTIGILLGGIAAFLISTLFLIINSGRYLFRDTLRKACFHRHKIFNALD